MHFVPNTIVVIYYSLLVESFIASYIDWLKCVKKQRYAATQIIRDMIKHRQFAFFFFPSKASSLLRSKELF